MRKKITLLFVFSIMISYAQESFSGFRTSSHSGVFGVLSNPAEIAAGPRRGDLNLLSISVGAVNDKLDFTLDNLNEKDLKSNLLNETGEISTLINTEVLGPSLMFTIGKNDAIAFTTRARIISNINNLDVKLLQSILGNEIGEIRLPYTISSNSEQKVILNGWSEVGFTWGKVLFSNTHHTLKIGATAKYLQGFSNNYIEIDKIRGTIEKEGSSKPKIYLTDLSGNATIINSGAKVTSGDDFQKFTFNDLIKSFGIGVGLDAGLVYEYRSDSISNWCDNCNPYVKKYKLKVSASIMDMGKIKYTPVEDRSYSYRLNVASTEKLYLDEVSSDPQKALDDPKYSQKTEITDSYHTTLPTSLRFMIDYRVSDNFFLALGGQKSITENKSRSPFYTDKITLTPRYEKFGFGVYFPMEYNKVSGTSIGTALRLGPLFFGSGSVISIVTGESKQIDFFCGVRFGG